MTSVSANFNGSVVNNLGINGDSSALNVIYVDAAKNLKVTRAYLDYTGTVIIGTSAIVV